MDKTDNRHPAHFTPVASVVEEGTKHAPAGHERIWVVFLCCIGYLLHFGGIPPAFGSQDTLPPPPAPQSAVQAPSPDSVLNQVLSPGDSTRDTGTARSDGPHNTPRITGDLSVPSFNQNVAAKQQKRMQLVFPSLSSKRKPVYTGSALLIGALVLQYAALDPIGRSLDADQIGDQFALMTPTLLALGMKSVGALMIGQQTNEAARAYKTFVDWDTPFNYTWLIFSAGIGFSLVSQVVNVRGTLTGNDATIKASRYIGYGIDACWVATGAYALWYFKSLEAKAAGKMHTGAVSLVPVLDLHDRGVGIVATFHY